MRVEVVLVNYNGAELLPGVLDALARQTFRPFRITVVDNGSTDASVRALTDRPYVKLIALGENRGFAGGNNAAVRASDAEYVVLLNTDTLPEPGWLEALVRRADAEANTAVVWSAVHRPDGAGERDTTMSTINPLGYTFHNVAADDFIFYASGSAVLFKRHLIGEPFPDEFFMYYEDVYLSWKARICGYDVVRESSAGVLHFGSVTVKKHRRIGTEFYQVRNRLLNLLIFYETGTLRRLLALIVCETKLGFLARLVTPGRRATAVIDAVAWIVKHMRTVRRLRARIQAIRKTADADIVGLMTPAFWPGGPAGLKDTLDRAARLYFSVFGIPVGRRFR